VPAPNGKGDVINVASYDNAVGDGKWTHIDGWSESVIEYIRALEQQHGSTKADRAGEKHACPRNAEATVVVWLCPSA
jgi:hypothetical protein